MALISLRQLLDHAAEHQYGLPAFNVNNMEQIQAIMEAANETNSPVIVQASRGARNYSQCDSMLIGDQAAANTYPYIRSQQPQAAVEHEASTCRISEDQLFYLQSGGIGLEEAVSMMVSGFCRDVFNQLPMEFAAEADKLLALKLEGSVG